jgi:hypothetical protein
LDYGPIEAGKSSGIRAAGLFAAAHCLSGDAPRTVSETHSPVCAIAHEQAAAEIRRCAMAQLSLNRVLVLGRARDALQDVMEQLSASGVSVQGSTDPQYAADLFDARDFDLISFGGAVSDSLNVHLRREFARQNPDVQFLDALAPIAAKQIVSALKGGSPRWQYLARSRLTEDGLDYLLKAVILKPCAVRIEVCRSFGAPPPSVELVDQSNADAGFFERRIDARYRTHGHILLFTLNDDEYCLHRMDGQ